MEPVSIYIHIPFCKHRCGYCDFNTYAGLDALIPEYIQAICQEIKFLANTSTDPVFMKTIYFGGGTPSLLPLRGLESILNTLFTEFQCENQIEITLEANPGTVSENNMRGFQELGVNRLSLGMQSAIDDELKTIERQHTFMDVVTAIDLARKAGIGNINLDLIYGLPHQELNSWLKSLEAALDLYPQHLSLYALTIEESTPFHNKIVSGLLPAPDQDLMADMYEEAGDRLSRSGFEQYEISNWARGDSLSGGYACKHNLQYWRYLPYLGIGAGAHGYIRHQRMVNTTKPGEYISRMRKAMMSTAINPAFPSTPATDEISSIEKDAEISEMMLMGLRLTLEGISNEIFRQRFGINLMDQFSKQIDGLISKGLLMWVTKEGEVLRLTKRGRLLGNQVFIEFLL